MPRRPSHPTLSTPPLSPVRQADSSVRVSPVRRLIYDDGQIIEGGQGAIPSVVLIGHSRALVLQMARRLVAVFPPPMHGSDDTWKSTIFVRGISLRLVLIEATLTAGASELADRVRRHTPKLVLMCADFYDVSSFESIVRHDLQVLHHLDVACAWILVKAAGMERRALHFVEDGDVRAAKHFLSSPRKCYLLHVDGAHHAANVHKLGLYIFRMVRGDVNRLPVEPVHPSAVSNRRCVSLLCLGLDIQKRKRTHRNSMYRQYANDLTTWINNG